MKHTLKITLILLAFFLISQVAGLLITKQYISVEEEEVSYSELPYDMDRPEVEQSSSYLFIIFGVLLGTVLLLLLIKFRQRNIWRIWYGLAVVIALSVALSGFMPEVFALVISLIVAFFKVLKPNVIIHNISEILIYGGISAIFAPIFNIGSAILLLVFISIYDIIAVWKSKHMVKLAKFQTKSNLFAGLTIPYSAKAKPAPVKENVNKGKTADKGSQEKGRTAILGGGDIAFPLLFTSVVMKELIYSGNAFPVVNSLIISVIVTVALGFLLFNTQKGRFYPAMPFISIGCLLGYLILLV